MPVPILYLDTSVIGGYFDDEWKDATQELWRQMEAGRYQFLTSAITMDELTTAPERVRELFADTFPAETVLGITAESERLASARLIARPPRSIATDIECPLRTRFTADTLAALRRRFRNARFVLLLGADNLAQLPRRLARWRPDQQRVAVVSGDEVGSRWRGAAVPKGLAHERLERHQLCEARVVVGWRD